MRAKSISIILLAASLSCITTTIHACEDSTEKFDVLLPDGSIIQRNCNHAAKNSWGQCEKPEFATNCPFTCRKCPGDIRCRIKADLQFPQGPELVGHYRASVQIEKAGEDRVCYSGDPKIKWGCTQPVFYPENPMSIEFGGDAFIIGENGFFNKRHASARIYDGRNGKFSVGVSHIFTEEEVLQNDPDYTKRANLIIKVNGVPTPKSFRHGKNTNRTTHLVPDQVNSNNDNVGFINPEYNGEFFVDIVCDDGCNCEIERREEVCKLKAQLKYPKIDVLEENGEYGIRSESLIVKNVNRDEECSQDNNTTSWCRSYGKAMLLNFENDFYYDVNTAQFINIPDASGGSFNFTKLLDSFEIPGQPLISNYAAEFTLYKNNEIIVDQLEDGGSVVVDCDGNCSCTIFTGEDR